MVARTRPCSLSKLDGALDDVCPGALGGRSVDEDEDLLVGLVHHLLRRPRFDVDETLGLKVPHMGWNQLDIVRSAPIYRDLPGGREGGANAYFVHSYHVVPEDNSLIATTTDYGRPFVSSIWRDNVMATQFHPEKSQKVGLGILSNFATM